MPRPTQLFPGLVATLRAHFGDRLTGVLVAGSVCRGDWIPFWSDIDVHVFVDGWSLSGLPPRDIFAIQDRLGEIEPSEYGVARIQLRTFDAAGYPATFVPPWPDTSDLLWGTPPVAPHLADLERAYVAKAERGLLKLDGALARLGEKCMSAPDDELPDIVLELSSILKDALFAAGIVLVRPARALTVRRDDLATIVGNAVGDNDSAHHFFTFARRWRKVRAQSSPLRQMFGDGHRAVRAVSAWAAVRGQNALLGQHIVECRRRKGWNQRKLAEVAGVSPDSVGLVEDPDYRLQKSPRYPSVLDLIAKALHEPLVDLLTLRTDEEIAGSAFAHLLGEVQRRRTELENGPRIEQ